MVKFFLLLLTISFSFFYPNLSEKKSSKKVHLRIMTYNIRNANGMDCITDYERIAAVIKSADPSIVAIQELDSFTQRNKAFALKEIADRTGYHYAFSAAISYAGGKYGIGILSKEKPLSVHNIPLPGREEKRTLQIAEFKNFTFFNAHFSLTEEDRIASVKIINAKVAKYKKPVFLAGDLNAAPSSVTIQTLKKNWSLLSGEAFTFPADHPDRCIDYIFSTPNNSLKITKKEVINDSIASDHRPVFIDVTFQK
jgi:endonuclease/exonuclease/phosphatase family metal-dependent hydrolase